MCQMNSFSHTVALLLKRSLQYLPPALTMQIECAAETDFSPEARKELSRQLAHIVQTGLNNGVLCPEADIFDIFLFCSPEEIRETEEKIFSFAGILSDGNYSCKHFLMLPILPVGNSSKLSVLPYCKKRLNSVIIGAYSGYCPELEQKIVDAVSDAYPLLCTPLTIGLGWAETEEKAMILSRAALTLPADKTGDGSLEKLEKRLRAKLRRTLPGPNGLSGNTSVLSLRCLGTSGTFALTLGCRYTMHAELEIQI